MPRTRVPLRKYKSFNRAVIFVVMFIAVLFIIRGINQSGLPSELGSLLNADFENFRALQQFEEDKSKEVQQKLAGFWTYSEGDPETSPVAKREYIELIDNGMIWMIREWFINTPSGDNYKVSHVANGFFNPYSYSPDNHAYFCEARIIRQAFVFDGDSCYGASQVDEIWPITINEDRSVININRRDYQPYTGDMMEFFPDGGALLDIVDLISLRRCPAGTDMSAIARRTLARYIDAVPFFAREQAVHSIIHTYYKPLVIDEIVRRYDPRAVPEEMSMRLTLSAEGAVTDLRYRPAKIATKRFDDAITPEMRAWLFPAVGDTDDAQRMQIVVRVK
jgi:ribosomal protein S17E